MKRLKVIFNKFVGVYYKFQIRRRIKNKDFTIISNNCWGGFVYKDLGIPYKTPTVGLFFTAIDYVKFLSDIKYYVNQPIAFVETSRYHEQNRNRAAHNLNYPIGVIGDIEIHFLHYSSAEEAIHKWTKRSNRINWDKLYVKMDDQNQCTPELIATFDKMPFKNKVFFSAVEYPNLPSVVYLPGYKKQGFVGDFNTDRIKFMCRFSIVKFLR